MSGFEIVGVVLGALPLAIEVLDRYGEVAKRTKSFIKIKLEYLEWKRRLRYSSLMYKRNLQDLLLPLILDAETEQDWIIKLIEDPFGTWRWWTEPGTARILEERLRGDSYHVYMDYIQAIEEVLEEIVDELALDDPTVQSMIAAPSKGTLLERLKGLRSIDNRHFQWHRFKYAVKSKERRTELFNILDDYNTRIEKLLGGNGRLNDLSVQPPIITPTQSKAATAVNSALCSFWVTADKFFNALASSWNCRCNTHCANLLLRHRTSATPEFEVLFTKEQPTAASWTTRKTRIVGVNGEKQITTKSEMSLPIHTPSHKDNRPLKSALGNTRKPKGRTAMFAEFQSATTVTLTEIRQEEQTTISSTISTTSTSTCRGSPQAIQCLCAALEGPTSPGIQGQASYGYLINDDIVYHIYDLPYQPDIQQHTTITLQNLIDSDLLPSLERKQRYLIALTIASSFVQLIDSPWLPTSTTLTKTDIVFLRNSTSTEEDDDDPFLDKDEPAFLNEPYVQRPFPAPRPTCSRQGKLEGKKVASSIGSSLEQLGIILLELCFGKRLRDQRCRRRYDAKSPAADDYIRGLYDVLAARDWQGKVLGEAGPGYAAAVDWCLEGNRSCAAHGAGGRMKGEMVKTLGMGKQEYKGGPGAAVEKWRKDMVSKVVGPLKMCCDYLEGEGLGDEE